MATTEGRRRNLTRLSTVAAGVLMTAGLTSPAAFAAATVAPSITVQPAAATAVVGGAPVVVRVDILNNDPAQVSLTSLNLATACNATGALPCTAGLDIFRINSITVDPSSITGNCVPGAGFAPAANPDVNSNVVYNNAGFAIVGGKSCTLLVSLSAVSPVGPSGATEFFLATATVNNAPAGTAATSPVGSSSLTVNAPTPPVTTPPTTTTTPPTTHGHSAAHDSASRSDHSDDDNGSYSSTININGTDNSANNDSDNGPRN